MNDRLLEVITAVQSDLDAVENSLNRIEEFFGGSENFQRYLMEQLAGFALVMLTDGTSDDDPLMVLAMGMFNQGWRAHEMHMREQNNDLPAE